jgi:8-hydroxy-5-deazaflavin:NADPH oxidoreductase
MTETVTVLGGTGSLGFGLALRLGRAGYAVCLGSRDAERGAEAATRAGALVDGATYTGGSHADAVAAADRLVVLTVPYASQVSTLAPLKGRWRTGQVVLDATVPLATVAGGRPTQLVQPWLGSAAAQARAAIDPEIDVVSGLHTISAAALIELDEPLEQDTLICGDRREAKAVVAEVLSGIDGLRVVDAGRLEVSRLVEGITPLLIGINIRNKTHAGLRITRLPGRV